MNLGSIDRPPAGGISARLDASGTTTLIHLEHRGTIVWARPADLLLVYKERARYQQINDVNGDPVTHVALLDARDGEVVTLEAGPIGFFSRTFEEFEPNYRGLAVVHLELDDEQRQRVLSEARQCLSAQPVRYTHAQCVGIGLYALARRLAPPLIEPVITALALTLASVAFAVHEGRRTTCSGALAQVFTAAGVRPLLAMPSRDPVPFRERGDLGAIRLRPARTLAERWRGAWTVTVSPSDLAATVPSVGISVVRAVRTTAPSGFADSHV